MRPHCAAIAVAAALSVLAPRAADADGGVVRASQPAGPFTITVFTAPTPLRAGPIDVSILVQDGRSGEVVGDASVTVTLRANEDPARQVSAAATRAQATNKLLYAALLDLPAAGTWQAQVVVDRRGAPATVAFAIDAEPPLPAWRAYWPSFALPPIAIAFYALHQWLALRPRRRAAATSPGSSAGSRRSPGSDRAPAAGSPASGRERG